MRPAYHYTARANWLSDPNGLVHDGAHWHMFYQYNPRGEDWGNMSWGHAVSDNLADWHELEPALLDDAREMVFSGSAVIDHSDSGGFGHGTMVALYTAAARGAQQHQSQALAFSHDKGTSWTRFAGNPVLDLGLADFRDPYVFRHEPSASWIMLVVKSSEQIAQVYRSLDLKQWTLASEIQGGPDAGRVWECPTLAELPICGQGRTRWLFKVDALHDAPGSGALYLTGDFDGFRFIPDAPEWQVVDHGRDFYAAIAWNGPQDPAGRPAWIGWMGNHAYQGRFPLRGWRGVMSAPRRLGLIECREGMRLSQQVEPSVARRFGDFATLAADSIPLASRIELSGVFAGTAHFTDDRGSSFTISAQGGVWKLTRRDAALNFLDSDAVLGRREGEGLALWIDSETIEVLTLDGTGSASFQHRPAGTPLALETDQPERVSVAALA